MRKTTLLILLSFFFVHYSKADFSMQSVFSREKVSLNGRWYVLPDPFGGAGSSWAKERKPRSNYDLNELYYEGGLTLQVPGDWNSQNPEFQYYEANMWYKRTFHYSPQKGKRAFIHFAAVNMTCSVFLNGKKLGSHKGGFTPFQFEITDKAKQGENALIVRVDCKRSAKTIPTTSFDWWNYGGITRDVDLIYTPETFVEDYFVRLKKGTHNRFLVDIQLNGKNKKNKTLFFLLPEKKIKKKIVTDEQGVGQIEIKANLQLWSPEAPKLYDVVFVNNDEKVADKIGFRSFTTQGNEILLNGKKIFLKGVNIHEEIAKDRRRAFSKEDAAYLIDKAVELGCNYIRLTHYPHNEYMVRLCEERGLMMWEEIPLWQSINFKDSQVCADAQVMLKEMIRRDKNRCGIVMWSVCNETWPTIKERNTAVFDLIKLCRKEDDSRCVTAACSWIFADKKDRKLVRLKDPIADSLDIIGINKYMGWYNSWRCQPSELRWETNPNKPMIISEFGAEALYGNHGDGENINSWSEEYMAKVYRDNLTSFKKIPNYRGISPWVLFDFRSPRRKHAMYQQGWNRKGLLSPRGEKKKAWYIMKAYYDNQPTYLK